MAKDYAKKHHAKKNVKKKRKSHAFLWFFTLILFVAFTLGLVYLGKHQRAIKHHTKTVSKHVVAPKPVSNATANKTVTPEPKFDFYTLLPQKNKDAIVPEYELEIATVKEFADADRTKAELSLLGFDVNIASLKKDNEQLYKVSIGPYDNKDNALADQNRLQQDNIKSVLKKIK